MLYGMPGFGSINLDSPSRLFSSSFELPSIFIRLPSKPVKDASPPVVLARTDNGLNRLISSGNTFFPVMKFPAIGRLKFIQSYRFQGPTGN